MNKFLKLDWILLISVGLLLTVSVLILYSISFNGNTIRISFLQKQIIAIGIGLGALFFMAFFDYRILDLYSTKLYFLMLLLLALVVFIGTTTNGTTGWLGFHSYHIQPVEIAKLIMVIFLASFLSKKKTQLSIAVRIVVSIILVFFPVFLIMKQPDFGSASVIVFSWSVLLFSSGLNRKNLLILILIGAICAFSSWSFLKTYQKERIMNFVNPQQDPMGSGYNAIQALVAVGSGQIWGNGLGHGSQSQLNFLPEKKTDFIFAVIAEELGFWGATAVIILLGIIFWRIKRIAQLASDNFGYLVAIGIMAIIFFQVVINIGMNIGIMPVVGIPLPFLSYGGSAMVVMLTSIGILENIYLRRIEI
jgi:rod shape determining protein RodA